MFNRFVWVLGVWAIAASSILAQTPPPPPPSISGSPTISDAKSPPAGTPVPPELIAPGLQGPQNDAFKFWVRAEYMAWWVKNTPQPISLVTGDPNNPTQELLDTNRSLGTFSAYRIGLGIWLDPYNNVGLETTFFSLPRRTRKFLASSDDTGDPTLAFPFTNQTPGAVGNFLMPITSPGLFAGSVLVASSLQMWGAEANAVLSVFQYRNLGGASPTFELTALVGFRFVDLYEKLNVSTLSADIVTTPSTVLFQSDQFNTRNQFYGGQIGARLNWQGDLFAFDVAGKLALGATHQTVDIQGFSTQTGPGGVNGTFPGGFFTQPSNIGRFTANQFSVIPSVEMKFHILLTQHVRAFLGYDFMYWTQVVRPGNQIDRNINLSQSTIYGSGVLSGPANPAPLFNRTDFWAQGVTFGFEFRF